MDLWSPTAHSDFLSTQELLRNSGSLDQEVNETGLKTAFSIKKNELALSIICARQSRCAINTLGEGWCGNRGSKSPGTSEVTTCLPSLSPRPTWINGWFLEASDVLCVAPISWTSLQFACHPLNNANLSSHDSYCFLEVSVQIHEQQAIFFFYPY